MIHLPNIISVSRILIAMMTALVYILGQYNLAIILFFILSISDFFDGYIARAYSVTSRLGMILDPVCDKCAFYVVFFAVLLKSAVIMSIYLQVYYVIIFTVFVTRDFFVDTLRIFSTHAVNIGILQLAKIKTSLQFFAMIFLLSNPLSLFNPLIFTIVAVFAVYTACEYYKSII